MTLEERINVLNQSARPSTKEEFKAFLNEQQDNETRLHVFIDTEDIRITQDPRAVECGVTFYSKENCFSFGHSSYEFEEIYYNERKKYFTLINKNGYTMKVKKSQGRKDLMLR